MSSLADPARSCPRARRCDRRGAGDRGRRGHDEFIGFLQNFLLAFGGHRALRRQLRDRELALDHDRPADSRAGDAAHARRLASAGARVDRGRGPDLGTSRPSIRPVRSASASPRAPVLALRRLGFTLPNNGLVVRRARSSSPCSSASSSRCWRACAPRCVRRVCRRSLRCAKARRCPSPLRPLPHARIAAADRIGFAALVYGLFGSGLGTTQVLVSMGIGTLLIFFGVALSRRASRVRSQRSSARSRRGQSSCSSCCLAVLHAAVLAAALGAFRPGGLGRRVRRDARRPCSIPFWR